MPGGPADDIPLGAKEEILDEGAEVGVLGHGADIEGSQSDGPDLGPDIGEQRVHAEPEAGPV